MGEIAKFSRRAFLIGSAALAGGVAFGTYAVAQEAANPLKPGLGPNSATFNPWVKISPEKITLITPHADIGQGVASAQAALIAEEMDLSSVSSRPRSARRALPITTPPWATCSRRSAQPI
jgi:isoquinoline 1-oxidoreductase beta subunit